MTTLVPLYWILIASAGPMVFAVIGEFYEDYRQRTDKNYRFPFFFAFLWPITLPLLLLILLKYIRGDKK